MISLFTWIEIESPVCLFSDLYTQNIRDWVEPRFIFGKNEGISFKREILYYKI